MVKFNLDSLKKMGSDVVNKAKNVDVSGMMDKIKNKVETVSAKFISAEKNAIDRVNTGLSQLIESQPNEAQVLKKIQAEFAEVQQRIEAVLAERERLAEIAQERKQSKDNPEDKNK